MLLKFDKLIIHNFMSIEDANISLDNNGFVKVFGINNNINDNASSNGSGKSAIWEAINWCITGDTIRGSKNIVRLDSEDGTLVLLLFYIDNNKFEIIRTKNHKKFKSNLFINKNDEDISGKGLRDTEILLKEHFPDLTSLLINSVVILGQGLPMRFTNNSPSGRKEVLEKLLKTDFMIDDLKTRILKRKQELEDEKQELDFKNIKLLAELKLFSELLDDLKNKLELIYSLNVDDIKNLIDDYKQKINLCDNNIYTIDKKYSDGILKSFSSVQDDVLNLNIKHLNNKNSIDDKYKELIFNLNLNVSLNDKLINKLKLDLKTAATTKICPTCGLIIQNNKHIDISSIEDEIKNLLNLNELFKSKISNITNEYNNYISDEDNSYNNLKQLINNNLENIKKDFDIYLLAKSSKAEYKLAYDLLVHLLDVRDTIITNYKQGIESLELKLANFNTEKLNIEEKLNDVNKRILTQKSFETLIKRDFRGILLLNCINYIDSKAKLFCKEIFDTDLISFKLDGNNISILYNNKEYESLSGGEKQKIDLIIQFSIRQLLCSYTNFSSNILVLDELTDNLDSVGCDKIISFIIKNLSDISSVYIISHRVDLDIPCDKTITVVKNSEGISSVLEQA